MMSSLMLILLSLVNVLALAASAQKRPRSAPCSLTDLPPELFEQIAERVADSASLALLSQTSRDFRHALRPLLAFRSLLQHSVRGRALSGQVRAYLCDLEHHHHTVSHIARRVTHTEALGLYDRLLDCRDLSKALKIKFLNVLIDQVGAFGEVIWGVDVRKFPVEVVHGVRERLARPSPVSWHVNLVDGAVCVTKRLAQKPLPKQTPSDVVDEVRKFHMGPFHAVFPHNTDFADQLLKYLCDPDSDLYGQPDPYLAYEFQRQNKELLRDHGVLYDLLRHGIRFNFAQFMQKVKPPADLLPQLYPLLRKPSLQTYHGVHDGLIAPSKKLLKKHYDHRAIALIRIPEVRGALLPHKILFVDLLCYAIRHDCDAFVEFLCQQPYAADLINGSPRRTLPLHVALIRSSNLPRLLQVPGVDLRALCPRSGRSAVSYLFDNRVRVNDLIRRVPADRIADLIRANPNQFFEEFQKIAQTKRHYIAHMFLRQPFMPEFINHRYGNDNHTLLHWALKTGACNVIDIMEVRDLDVSVTDADGHVPFHYLSILRFFSELNHDSLCRLVRTDLRHMCTLLSSMLQNQSDGWLQFVMAGLRFMPEIINSVSSSDGCAMLHIAFQRNEFPLVAQLLTIRGINLNCADHAGRVPFSYFKPNQESVTALTTHIPAAQMAALIRTDAERFVSGLIQHAIHCPEFFPFLIEQPFIEEILFVRDYVTGRNLLTHALLTQQTDCACRLLEIGECFLLKCISADID